jgi:hypothetical protein
MNGPNANPNVANTGGGQIKSNQMEAPRKKSKSNPNQIPAQRTPNETKFRLLEGRR